jgi:hypothetical protein
MKHLKYVLVWVGLFFFRRSEAQDTLNYRQKDASLFSNTYAFYSNGTFEHFFRTDDFQTWYGRGHYKSFRNRYQLTFEKAEPPKAVVVQVLPSVLPDTIVLKLLNLRKPNEVEFIPKVRIWNPRDQKTVEIDFQQRWDTIAKIPRRLFKGLTTVQIPKSIWGNEVLVQIPEPKGTQGVEIQLFADIGMGGVTHYIEPKPKRSKKRGRIWKCPIGIIRF